MGSWKSEILIYYNQKGKKFNLDRNDDELEQNRHI